MRLYPSNEAVMRAALTSPKPKRISSVFVPRSDGQGLESPRWPIAHWEHKAEEERAASGGRSLQFEFLLLPPRARGHAENTTRGLRVAGQSGNFRQSASHPDDLGPVYVAVLKKSGPSIFLIRQTIPKLHQYVCPITDEPFRRILLQA